MFISQANRWLKRGLGVSVYKYPIGYTPLFNYSVYVVIYITDGTVAVSHGGVEIGQGIHTKVTGVDRPGDTHQGNRGG